MTGYKDNIQKSIICLYNINKESLNCFSDNYKAFITASANKIPMIKSNERYERLLRIHISPLPSTTKQQAENIPTEIPIKILLEKRV